MNLIDNFFNTEQKPDKIDFLSESSPPNNGWTIIHIFNDSNVNKLIKKKKRKRKRKKNL
ncbi:unnamed protein product [marine sediment metagenome]|uniref:Uncharacterized protein n=1 Tax=marine sediment metagenome TaxID=412755 RepID=X1CEN2_9ZZZZ